MTAHTDDRGVATVWAAGVIAVVVSVAVFGLYLGAAMVTRHHAASAADLAALAAAAHLLPGEPEACTQARRVTDRTRVQLVSCHLRGWDVLVDVSAQPPGWLGTRPGSRWPRRSGRSWCDPTSWAVAWILPRRVPAAALHTALEPLVDLLGRAPRSVAGSAPAQTKHYADGMPLFSDTEGPAPKTATPASVGMVVEELISAARAGNVVYLTGPGDDDVVAVAPVEVVEAGLAALGRAQRS